MDTHNQASRMENGEAGTSLSSSSTMISDKGSSRNSTDRRSNLQSSLSRRANPHTSRWIRTVRTRLRPGWLRSERKVLQPHFDIPKPTVRKPSSSPRGYPSLAAFLDSDESFMIYRRFGFLQSRLLLDKQDELSELEKRLEKMDRIEAKNDKRWPMTRGLPDERLEIRTQLLKEIEERFCSYANLLSAAQKMVAMHHPAKRDYKSVRNFMYSHNPLMEREASWVDHGEDMITLRAGREHAWLDSGIERLLKWFHCSLLERIFGDERSRQKSSNLEIYYSRERITRLANGIITIMILVLLTVPIYTLYHLVNDIHTDEAYAICMGILVVATLAFSAVLSLFTKAKRHEILAAAAAYCAVLVVFLGNVGPNSRLISN